MIAGAKRHHRTLTITVTDVDEVVPEMSLLDSYDDEVRRPCSLDQER